MTYRHCRHGIFNRYNRGIKASKASLPTFSLVIILHIANSGRPWLIIINRKNMMLKFTATRLWDYSGYCFALRIMAMIVK